MKHFKKVRLILVFLLLSNTFYSFSQTGDKSKNTKSDPNVPIFEIKNDLGQTVFAVYPGGVKIFIDDQLKAAGGGFTVGRISTEKATSGEYFIVNPNNVKVLIDETIPGLKAAGGGFTVGRISTEKAAGDEENFLTVTPDSTRIYINESSSAGFAVGKLGTVETGLQNFMFLKRENYFIGHNSGKLTTGLYNLFLGYESGLANTEGHGNTFLGFQAGYSNLSGRNNVYIGYEAGHANTNGSLNVFIGYQAGKYSNTSAHDNVFIGFGTARDKTEGSSNVMLGKFTGVNTGISDNNVILGDYAGAMIEHVYAEPVELNNNVIIGHYAARNGIGTNNVILGTYAGYNLDPINSSGNVFLGYNAGRNESGSNRLYIDNTSSSSPLIYGEFDTPLLRFNAPVGINGAPNSNRALEINLDGDDAYALVAYGPTWCTSGTWAGSDIRFKKNVKPYKNALNKIIKLRGVSYEWKTKQFPKKGFAEGKTIGLIAQEIELVIPELVNEGPEGYKSVAYDKLTAVLIEAVKEQQKIISNLENRINKLEEKNEKLSSEVSEFQSMKTELDVLKAMVKEVLIKKQELNNTAETNK